MGTPFAAFQHPFAPMTPAEQLQLTPTLIFAVLEFCLSSAYLALWRAAPDYRVFRKMGLFLAFICFEEFWEYFGGGGSAWVLREIGMFLLIPTAAEAMQIPIPRWKWFLWPAVGLLLLEGWFPATVFFQEWPVLVSQVALAVLLFWGWRRGSDSDSRIVGAFTVLFLVRWTLSGWFQRHTGIRSYLSLGGWRWMDTAIVLTILAAVTLAVFVRQLILDRQEKLRLATELEAARSVQNVLIPESIAKIPGYAITSAYRPALEVGGDFFQVIPLAEGQTLVVLGDVSGKGLKAAMAVSFILGALRTLIDRSHGPSELLTQLDFQLKGRLQGGFATAIALSMDSHGRCAIASAGHPAPFLNDQELDMPGSLPLGLGLGAVYEEASFQLQPRDCLSLFTDGLLEARSAAGELYSFERLKLLFSTKPTAEQATEAAVAFGQDDDITVLTLTRMAV